MSPRSLWVGELDSRSWEQELRRDPLVILPVGALEAHGPHLPLSADQIQAERTAVELASAHGGFVLPSLCYGVCRGARNFPGTVTLSLETLARLSEEVLTETARMGARRLLVLSGHAEAPHMVALREGAEAALRSGMPGRVLVLSDYDFVYELRGTEAPVTDGHAGLLETSRLLALAPDLVGKARPLGPSRRSRFRAGAPTAEEWPESVLGDPGAASAELGQRVQRHVLERLGETVRSELAGGVP
ncbi:MAG: creatininase family protein [Thermoplasmata archaeon]|nr:creatininase family protein [Thermoplasmata archaeon]